LKIFCPSDSSVHLKRSLWCAYAAVRGLPHTPTKRKRPHAGCHVRPREWKRLTRWWGGQSLTAPLACLGGAVDGRHGGRGGAKRGTGHAEELQDGCQLNG
jgi:hypothetical protein